MFKKKKKIEICANKITINVTGCILIKIKNTKAFFHFKDDRSLKPIYFFKINSLNYCVNNGPNKTDKNSGLIFIF